MKLQYHYDLNSGDSSFSPTINTDPVEPEQDPVVPPPDYTPVEPTPGETEP
jgi:hypothetical protein